MKICPNCHSSNEEGLRFCCKCGTNIEVQQSFPVAKKTSRTKIVVTAIIALILIFAAIVIIRSANPTSRLMNAIVDLSDMEPRTVDANIKFSYKGDNEQLELLKDAIVNTTTAVNLDKFLMESSLEFLYDNQSVAKAVVGYGEGNIYGDLPKLYNKKFFYEIDSDIQAGIDEAKILVKYLKDINLKFDVKRYSPIVKDILDDNISGSLGKVTVTLDTETMSEILLAIIEEAMDDEKLMESVRKDAAEVIKKILNDKETFEVLFDEDAYAGELEDALEQLEDKDDFEDLYVAGLENALSSIESELKYRKDNPEYYENEPELEMTFSFDLFNKLTGFQYAMKIENESAGKESMEISINAKIKNGSRFTNVNKNGSVSIEDLIEDQDEALEIAEEVMKNLLASIKKNKALVKTLEDISGEDIDDLDDYMIDNLF